jgi:BirA family biotin operon repressor/biotin-[acetyl-CoA-carboxylase] ligase
LEQAKQGAPSGSVCLAEQQTKGRGRLGRSWYSPASSNIYCSVLWRFPAALKDISGLSIAVGVMLVNTLRKYGVQAGLQLKWPNDVLSMGRKLAGILLESNSQSTVVIGIGLNLAIEQAKEKNWIDVTELTGQIPRRNFLVGLLLNELLASLSIYAERGLTIFLTDWQKHDALLNQEIIVMTPEKNITGMMRGINQAGELLLQDETGKMHAFCYGEVSIRNPSRDR